jgi:hypothetical protein
MPVLTFEILCNNEEPVIADVLTLPDEPAMSRRAEAWLSNERAIWCRAEALALRIGKKGGNAFIRVRNSDGTTVVLAGVATALASIEKCSCVACPLKGELKGRVSSYVAAERRAGELVKEMAKVQRRPGEMAAKLPKASGVNLLPEALPQTMFDRICAFKKSQTH